MKVLLVVGARPNFMKIASVIHAIDAHNARSPKRRIERVLVHTGQHYDEKMSGAFFEDLGLPRPDVDLEVGSGTHAAQTAEVMKRFEPVLLRERPDAVLVVGDVNSTIACSLVAAKAVYPDGTARRRPLVAHVEAGLRSRDRSMPEEVNRVLTDAIADLLFLTESSAARNLTREGVARSKIHFVGNTMVDTLLRNRERAARSDVLERLGLGDGAGGAERYAVLTLHRPSNVDDRAAFTEIVEALAVVARDLPILFPVHPRTAGRIREFGLERHFDGGRIRAVEPLGYLDFLRLLSSAALALTDSGGIQEETTALGVPCVTLRENTERPITISQGTNVLAGMKKKRIVREARRQLGARRKRRVPRYWDGRAGERIVKVLARQRPS